MSRVSSHVIETKTRDLLRSKIDNFYNNGDALFRDVTERDYGIDAIIELFDQGTPTGMMALIQIKGSQNHIEQLKNDKEVSCEISTSSAHYAEQNRIPVILVYVYIGNPFYLYFAKLQDVITEEHKSKIDKQKSITVRIPNNNIITTDFEPLFEMIRTSY